MTSILSPQLSHAETRKTPPSRVMMTTSSPATPPLLDDSDAKSCAAVGDGATDLVCVAANLEDGVGEVEVGEAAVAGIPKVLHVVDNNLPPQLAALLEKNGVQAISVRRAMREAADDQKEIIPYLKAHNATIITKDAGDFSGQIPADQIIHIPTGNASGKAADLLEYLRSIIGF